MINPTSGGDSIVGRIRLDLSQLRRDAAEATKIQQNSAREQARAFNQAAQAEARAIRQRERIANQFQKQALRDAIRAIKEENRAREQAAREAVRIEQRKAAEIARAQKRQQREDRAYVDKFIKSGWDNLIKTPSKTPFQEFSKSVGEARVALLGFTAAASGLIFFGIKAADEINILTTRYRELTGSQTAAARVMKQIETTARSMNVPIRQAQKDFLGLIPAVREVNGDLGQYMNLSLRLAMLNTDSRGGLEGAIYAIREALASGGTDLVSLSERFNIPRRALKDLIKETGSLSSALDIILDRYGATTEAAKAQSQSVGTLAAQIRDSLVQVLERTFAPALLMVRDLLKGINEFIRSLPQPIVDLAAGFVIATGATAALVLATETLGSGWNNLLKVATKLAVFLQAQLIPSLVQSAAAIKANNFSSLSTLGKVGVTGGALAAGAAIGIGGLNAFGRATGDERLANYGLDDAFTTFKQIIGIIGKLFLDLMRGLSKAIAPILLAFTRLGDSIAEFVLRLKVAILDVGIAINQMLGNTAEMQRLEGQRGLPITEMVETPFETAEGTKTIPMAQITGYTGVLGELMRLEQARNDAITQTNDGIDEVYDNLTRGLFDLLFPVERITDVAIESINLIESIATDVQNRIYAAREAEGKRIAEGFDQAVSFASELAELMETGDTDAVDKRIQSLERERESLEQLIPTLAAYADDSQEAADKLQEAKDRLLEINNTIPQFIDALTAATQRALAEAYDKYKAEVEKAETEKQDALLKIGLDTAEAMRNLRDDLADKQAELNDKQLKIQDDYNKAILKAEADLRRRLLEIQENFMKASRLAASQLDAAGVAAAINKRNEDIRKAQRDFGDDVTDANEKRGEQQAAFQKELIDLRDFYAKRREEIFRQNVEETAKVQAAYAERIALADAARMAERERLMAFYDQRLVDLQNAAEMERQLRQSIFAQQLAETANHYLNMLNIGRTILGNLNLSAAGFNQNQIGTLGSALTTGIGAALQATPNPLSGLGQLMINVNGVTDPIQVGDIVLQKIISLAGGTN